LIDDLNKAGEKLKSGAKKIADDLGVESEDLKKGFNETAEKVKKEAKEILEVLDKSTKEFQEEAKSTANEFTKGAKDAYEDLVKKENNKKIIAGVLAILFGSLGAHKFILGYNKEGLIMLVLTVLGSFLLGMGGLLMAAIGFIEGIIYLTKSDEDFYNTYQKNKKPWF